MNYQPERYKCDECAAIVLATEVLHAPSPFDPEDILSGCPVCQAVNSLSPACQYPGCDREGTWGQPVPPLHIRTCYDHRLKDDQL